MKIKLLLLGILVLGFLLFIAYRYFVLSNQNTFGKLKIDVTPSATVFINDVAAGKTPFENKYKVGEYLLKLIPEKTATSTASWQGKIKIYKNALTYVDRELGDSDVTSAGEIFTVTKMDESPKTANTGEVYVETDPQGAIVYLDNDEKGVAPVILSDVLKGDHELSIYMPQFVRRTQKINVDVGYRVSAYFKLAIDQTLKKPTPTESLNQSTPSASITPGSSTKKTIIISDTPTGWLRVREEPNVNASESARVNPGDKYEVLEEQSTWYKIQYSEGKTGWISSEYTKPAE